MLWLKKHDRYPGTFYTLNKCFMADCAPLTQSVLFCVEILLFKSLFAQDNFGYIIYMCNVDFGRALCYNNVMENKHSQRYILTGIW